MKGFIDLVFEYQGRFYMLMGNQMARRRAGMTTHQQQWKRK